ncbi:MAG: thiolase family protein [Firmicutes bacterium]|nr:thiolase family protein [Bacillota bacterium]
MRKAVIVKGVRTAIGKAPDGSLKDTRPDDLAAFLIREIVNRTPELDPEEIEDIILGCAFPEAEQGMNIARISALRAGLPVSIPGMTINRFCASGIQAVAAAAHQIQTGAAEVILAGGVESMSLIPMGGNKFSSNPYLAEHYPNTYLSMGLTAEKLQEKYSISREEQDKFSYQSHLKALKAIQENKFKEEIVPYSFQKKEWDYTGKTQIKEIVFQEDEGPRKDTSLDKLSKLKPAFKENGTVTAGNSSQMSDGSAVVLMMSEEKAQKVGLKPKARFISYAVSGVEPEIMGIGPVKAVPKALKMSGLTLQQIGLIELNEAFAAQTLAVLKSLELNPEIVNVNGGAIALGHPLGCTGTRLTITLINEMRRRKIEYGMVTLCIGGGMGAAAIFELNQNP